MYTNYNKMSDENTLESQHIPTEKNESSSSTNFCSKEPITASVSCALLNVREFPSKDSAVLCVVKEGSSLMVDTSDGEWVHVYTPCGMEGYVVKQFIKED